MDLNAVRISCSGWEQIVDAVNNATRALPKEIRKRLGNIFSNYLALYDLEGTYDRMNNRSVEQIFAQYRSEEKPPPVISGEVDGMSFRLYEAPCPPSEKDKKKKA